MPKQLQEIKDFLLTASRKGAKSIQIKKNKDNVKIKVRCSRYLYTLVIQDREKAEKLRPSLPPGLTVTCHLAITWQSPGYHLSHGCHLAITCHMAITWLSLGYHLSPGYHWLSPVTWLSPGYHLSPGCHLV
ncbi:hypothetical protein BsWGS_22800 [Bradybaena similaris]